MVTQKNVKPGNMICVTHLFRSRAVANMKCTAKMLRVDNYLRKNLILSWIKS